MYKNKGLLSPANRAYGSKKKQELYLASRKVRLQAKSLKTVAKTAGIDQNKLAAFVLAEQEKARVSGYDYSRSGKETHEARIAQAVASVKGEDGCSRMSVRRAAERFNISKSTLQDRLKDPFTGSRVIGRYQYKVEDRFLCYLALLKHSLLSSRYYICSYIIIS